MQRKAFSALVFFNTAFVVGREISFSYPSNVMIAAEVEQNTDLVDDDEKVIKNMPVSRTAIYCEEENLRRMMNGTGIFALSGRGGLEYKTTIKNISTMVVMVNTKGLLRGDRTYSQRVIPKSDQYLTKREIEAAIDDVRDWQRSNVSSFWKWLI